MALEIAAPPLEDRGPISRTGKSMVAAWRNAHNERTGDMRKVVVYYARSRPAETGAPLGVIENRFPTLFESRRMGYPAY